MDVQIPKDYFRATKLVLFMAGIEMYPIDNIYLRYMYRVWSAIALIIFLYVFVIMEAMSLMYVWGDLNGMSFTLSYLITHVIGLLKVTFFLVKKKPILKYMQTIESGTFLPNAERGGLQEVRLVESAVRDSVIQVTVFIAVAAVIVTNRGMFALMENIYEYEVDEIFNTTVVSKYHPVPFSTWLPCNVKRQPCYAFMYIFQCFCYFGQAFYVGGVDSIVWALMLHLRAQFLILKHLIKSFRERAVEINIMKNSNYAVNGQIPDEYLQEILQNITGDVVQHHKNIINLTQEMENEFNSLLLIQFLGSLILLCFALFQVSITEIASVKFVSIMCYTALMSFELYMFCFYGNEVTLESALVSRYAFESDWVGTDHKIQTSWLLMMARAQKPLRLTAGKFTFLSLETFVTIIRGSVSYYMVLRNTILKNM